MGGTHPYAMVMVGSFNAVVLGTTEYRIAGIFRGVLIFVIFVINLKFSNHEKL